MNFLSQLPKIVANRPKRQGRGYGSGKGGHTAGRGSKGHKARGSVSVIFTGTKHKKSLWQRLPAFKGRKFFGAGYKTTTVNMDKVVKHLTKSGQEIDLEFLLKHKIIRRKQSKTTRVKLVMGRQDLPKKNIKLKLAASQKLKQALKLQATKPKPPTKKTANTKTAKKQKSAES